MSPPIQRGLFVLPAVAVVAMASLLLSSCGRAARTMECDTPDNASCPVCGRPASVLVATVHVTKTPGGRDHVDVGACTRDHHRLIGLDPGRYADAAAEGRTVAKPH